MSISRVKTWTAGEVLTASDLNAEVNNIINNPVDLWSPAGKAVDFDGQTITLDAAGVTNIASSATQALQLTPGAKSGTPGTTGGVTNIVASTYTDSATAQSGTATAFAANAFQRPTLAATNTGVTTTDAAVVLIANNVLAGTNETITNNWALWVAGTSGTATLIRIDGAVVLNPYGTSSGNTGELRCRELAANGVNYVGFKAADSLAGNVVWTLPSADGSSGQLLSTNGSGTLSFTTVTQVNNRVVRTAGDVTTTSTSLIDLTGASITLTTGATAAAIGFVASVSNNTSASGVYLNVDIDGSLQFGTNGLFDTSDSGGADYNGSFTTLSATLTAASHTFKVQWRVDGNTGRIRGNTGQNYVFWVHEVR